MDKAEPNAKRTRKQQKKPDTATPLLEFIIMTEERERKKERRMNNKDGEKD